MKGDRQRLRAGLFSSLPRPQGPEFLPVVVLSVCKLLCFPFALDVDADLLVGVLADLRASEVAVCLLQVYGGVPPVHCSLIWFYWNSAERPGTGAQLLGQELLPWHSLLLDLGSLDAEMCLCRARCKCRKNLLLGSKWVSCFRLWGQALLPRRSLSLAWHFGLPALALLCHCRIYLSLS